jgi:hypothetical protein
MLSEFLKNGKLSAFLSSGITPIIALTPLDRKEEQLSLFLKSGNLVNFLQSKREIVTIEKQIEDLKNSIKLTLLQMQNDIEKNFPEACIDENKDQNLELEK